VGFENHGGRDIFRKNRQTFTRGLYRVLLCEMELKDLYTKNAIGSYLHGPAASKNPQIADWLIEKS